MDETLRAAVEALAQAHIAQDHALFASFMTPHALLDLRGGLPVRPRRYEVLHVAEHGESGESEVRFRGGGSFVLRQQWERGNGHWRVIASSIPGGDVRLPVWSRLRRLLRLEAGAGA